MPVWKEAEEKKTKISLTESVAVRESWNTQALKSSSLTIGVERDRKKTKLEKRKKNKAKINKEKYFV